VLVESGRSLRDESREFPAQAYTTSLQAVGRCLAGVCAQYCRVHRAESGVWWWPAHTRACLTVAHPSPTRQPARATAKAFWRVGSAPSAGGRRPSVAATPSCWQCPPPPAHRVRCPPSRRRRWRARRGCDSSTRGRPPHPSTRAESRRAAERPSARERERKQTIRISGLARR
jgi:hypothetical protein